MKILEDPAPYYKAMRLITRQLEMVLDRGRSDHRDRVPWFIRMGKREYEIFKVCQGYTMPPCPIAYGMPVLWTRNPSLIQIVFRAWPPKTNVEQ